MVTAVEALLSHLIDYAGLFPPAQLNLQEALHQYLQYRSSDQAWMLGRFVVPLSQVGALISLIPAGTGLPISVILDAPLSRAIPQLQDWREAHASVEVAAIDIPPTTLQREFHPLPPFPQGLEVYGEVSWEETAHFARHFPPSFRAKIRTGGLTPAAFPTAPQLAQVIAHLAQAKRPFKATAGLHHALPGHYPLSSHPESPVLPMQGFLNLAIAAAFAYHDPLSLQELETILASPSLRPFHFTAEVLQWEQRSLTLTQIHTARRQFFQAFGSCSFQDPIHELAALSLIPSSAQALSALS